MMRALYTAASGMIAEQTNVDTISNNLANVNTNGFKTERTEFKSLLYQTLQTKTTTANGENKPVGAQVGLGTRVAATTSMYTQGAMLASESKTDYCLDGQGFFAVRGIDGQTYYTRNGNFTWNTTGDGRVMLTDHSGQAVLDAGGNPIYVPNGVPADSIEVSQTGRFAYVNPDGSKVDMGISFGVYQFNNPAGLEKISDSLLQQTGASGQPLQEGVVQGLKTSKVLANYLEGSNVQVADEMVNLIIAQRAYELNSKAITTADSMLDTANNLKR